MTIRISYLILLRILLLDLTPLIIRINTTLCKILLLLLFRYSFVSIFESFITATQERSTSTLYSHLFFLQASKFWYSFVIFLHISVGEILKTINTQIRLVLTIVLHLSPTVLAIVYVFWEMVYSCIQNEGFQTFLPFCLALC